MSASRTILINNPWDFRVRGFRDSRISHLLASYLNAATTHTWGLRTAAGTGGSAVANGSLDYQTGSNGDYVGGLVGDEGLIEGAIYWVTLKVVQGDVSFEANYPVEAVRRTGATPSS